MSEVNEPFNFQASDSESDHEIDDEHKILDEEKEKTLSNGRNLTNLNGKIKEEINEENDKNNEQIDEVFIKKLTTEDKSDSEIDDSDQLQCSGMKANKKDRCTKLGSANIDDKFYCHHHIPKKPSNNKEEKTAKMGKLSKNNTKVKIVSGIKTASGKNTIQCAGTKANKKDRCTKNIDPNKFPSGYCNYHIKQDPNYESDEEEKTAKKTAKTNTAKFSRKTEIKTKTETVRCKGITDNKRCNSMINTGDFPEGICGNHDTDKIKTEKMANTANTAKLSKKAASGIKAASGTKTGIKKRPDIPIVKILTDTCDNLLEKNEHNVLAKWYVNMGKIMSADKVSDSDIINWLVNGLNSYQDNINLSDKYNQWLINLMTYYVSFNSDDFQQEHMNDITQIKQFLEAVE